LALMDGLTERDLAGRRDMAVWRIVYWLLTGALIGFGLIAILSIGALFLALGMILAVIGALRVDARGIWAALVGFGALPAGILIWDVVSAPWACQGPGISSLPNVNYFGSCPHAVLPSDGVVKNTETQQVEVRAAKGVAFE
jgi:hypothetical protein